MAAAKRYELFKCLQALARGNHVVDDQHALTLHEFGVRSVQKQMLAVIGCDRIHFHAEYVLHVELGGFTGQQVAVYAFLTGHLVGQRNALGLRSDDHVVLGSQLEKVSGAAHGQLHIAENDEPGDA